METETIEIHKELKLLLDKLCDNFSETMDGLLIEILAEAGYTRDFTLENYGIDLLKVIENLR